MPPRCCAPQPFVAFGPSPPFAPPPSLPSDERRSPLPPLPAEDPDRLRARLTGLLDAALDCIITVDHEGRLIDFNRAAERTFGYTKAEVMGLEMAEVIVPPALRDRHRAGMARLNDGEAPRMLGKRIEITAVRRDGTEFPVELAITRVDLGPDSPPVYTAHLRDITERKRTEADLLALQNQLEERIAQRTAALRASETSLRESQELFAKSFHGSPALMAISKWPDGRLIEVNVAFQKAFGRTKSELIGRTPLELGFWADPQQRHAFYREFERERCVRGFEASFQGAGGMRTLLLNADLIEVGARPAALIVGLDATAQREAALALAEAKEAADAANRAKSHFLANMSHELRTPLNGILGYAQILARDPLLGPPQLRGIEVIHRSAEHLLGLINDVLDLSKIEAGRLDLNLETCDLPSLLHGVEELLKPRAQVKGLAFVTRFAPDLPPRVVVDEGRLRQVLLNLLGNALKFTRKGQVEFSVQAGAPTRSGHARLTFSVADTGAGIAPEDLGRLFQPFVQVGDTGPHADGTGLGLVISRSLVSAMGGELRVESRPGAGSRFWFDLELPLAGQTTAPREPSRRIVGYDGPRRRLLVTDDQETNREVLAGLLASAGFEVDQVESGEAAIAYCAQRLPDAILMDLRMNGMSGLEATRILRAAHGPDLPVIAVSASAYDLDRNACRDAGCNDFLPKPVEAEQLWHALGRLLSLTWTHAAGPSPDDPSAGREPPPRALAQAFHDLARAGDVVELRHRAELLLRDEPRHAEFARSILDLATQFKLKAIRQLLAPLLDDSPDHGTSHHPDR